MQSEEVVVAGAGPAGSSCALELAKRGIYATVFDHTHPREKPCGGAILPSVLDRFPFVKQFGFKSGSLSNLKIISPNDIQITTNQFRGGFVVSRLFFDNGLINSATQNGAHLVKEKIIEIQKKSDCWKIRTNKRILSAKILVGADGVNSLIRRRTIGAIPRSNLALTYGYMATCPENTQPVIKFTREIPGYIWIFHRNDYSSIGIGSELKHGSSLKKILDDFLCSYYSRPLRIASKFSAMLPSATEPDYFNRHCAGENWVLVGDAAGHVDPISREGILYALWSGKLAAEAINDSKLKIYDSLWRENYGAYLKKRCQQKPTFYDPTVLNLAIRYHSLSGKLLA